ncbi:hypothetical protein GCM10008090_32820 [Arenicella chitinivorans]|uniref:Flagellar biosynthesis protein n=1 Tax=Arenicella chitinivorans TaxID=1329800 RepID=A0A918S294_9GAMM|nr:YajG family lipoprotein [Arenicella chitinivorans]GHA20273.1 hypothetical protein GCM10008090_32820 [Arenicella chitinivorans]
MNAFKLTIVLLALLSSTACVTGTRNLQNLEIPEYTSDKSGAGLVFIGPIVDKRGFEQKPKDPSTPSVKGDLSSVSAETRATLIGRQRNGYGKAMGDVALPVGVTVQDKMHALLKTGLESRGYTVVDDANAETRVAVDINEFWAWFSPGFVSVSFESKLQSDLSVESANGKKAISVSGYGLNKGQVASDANWELAFKRGFQNFLENLDTLLDESGL